MDKERKFDLEVRLMEFTIRIISAVELLPDSKVSNYLGGQLLRSGCSPVLNYGEDRSGNIWWGTGQGLYRFDGKRFYQVKKDGPW